MKINSFSNLNFKSTSRNIYVDNTTGKKYASDDIMLKKGGGNFLYSNLTWFFRSDLANDISGDWSVFRKNIADFFKTAKRVNVYNFASSDGSEAYSFAISMIEELGKEADKFFPIAAYDLDKQIIDEAKKGIINCDDCDIFSINKNTNGSIDKYFSVLQGKDFEFPYCLCPNEKLRNSVRFSRGDFLEKIKRVKPKNSLILCRNFWSYIPYQKNDEAVKLLANSIDNTSLFVIGKNDRYRVVEDGNIKKYGFREIHRNIFQKQN